MTMITAGQLRRVLLGVPDNRPVAMVTRTSGPMPWERWLEGVITEGIYEDAPIILLTPGEFLTDWTNHQSTEHEGIGRT